MTASDSPDDDNFLGRTVEVLFTSEFKRNLRRLAKKYRGIRGDIQPLIEQLAAGRTPGDRIPGVGYPVFKVRAKNSDARSGKSGGYRIIYYMRTHDDKVLLVTLYSKTEQGDVAAKTIHQIIAKYDEGETN